MYGLQDWAAVQRVYKQTKSKRATAEILGIARNTVSSLLEKTHAPVYHRTINKSCLDPYKEIITKWRTENEFNGTRIYEELKNIGYTHSIGPVYRYLRILDQESGKISSLATVRIETPLGDQAQFDWTEYNVVVDSMEQKVYCFSLILAASRKKAICFSLKEDAAAIYEAIQELFEDLGGVTLELLIDNPKALVDNNDPKNEEDIRYNPYAMLLAKHLGTELNACPCYWPRKKGKVESPFKYIEEHFIKGNTFSSMEDLNRRGKEFINNWCETVHGTTKRIPNEHYLLEEKATLLPLPKTRFRHKALIKRHVSIDSLVSIGANKYSVPVKYVDKDVLYRIVYGFRIEIYDMKENLILTTEAFNSKHNIRKYDEHYAEIMVSVSTSAPQVKRDFIRIFNNGQRYLDAVAKYVDQPFRSARKIMELRDLYDDATLDLFLAYSIEQDKVKIQDFKGLLRAYNSGTMSLPFPSVPEESTPKDKIVYTEDDPELTRDCSYYETEVSM